ncbi:adenylate/guanylate cyclase domain-containing protein [Pseudooctadecabacter sp.]|uniref:adenylate/guanylate cyclase domain-containing protein n=1 Tax=Pseudooctadecabacter sp. TaxID=1966338 RepID=UPI0035C7FEC5
MKDDGPDDPYALIALAQKALRRVEKRLAKSELRRSELEHLMDTRQAFQARVLEQVEEAKTEIEKLYDRLTAEQALTEQLLLSIMPETVSRELREIGSVTPQRAANATVMFTDFVEFTRQTEQLDPTELVAILDHYYSAFDRIAAEHRVEKVKTIGDAFMCVSGLNGENDAADRMTAAAQAILSFVAAGQAGGLPSGIPAWSLRVGLAAGPVSAGVVGHDRLSFDIWGDTVNTASRMVAAAPVNGALMTQQVWAQLSSQDGVRPKGQIELRGKGRVDVYEIG